MKIFTAILLICLSANLYAAKKGDNKLTRAEKKSGWTMIFDGKTTKGWRGYTKKTMPEKGWDVVDGALHCQSKGGGGDIIFDTPLKNFELTLNWKISEGGNSGIFIHGKEVQGAPIYHSAPEYQVLDNERHPDAKLGKNGNRKSGSLYDMIPATPQNAHPALQWNETKIISKDGKVAYWLNGVNVVNFQMGDEYWKIMCAGSKFKDWSDFVNNPGIDGYIGLQDHGNDVWYKNIKLKVLE